MCSIITTSATVDQRTISMRHLADSSIFVQQVGGALLLLPGPKTSWIPAWIRSASGSTRPTCIKTPITHSYSESPATTCTDRSLAYRRIVGVFDKLFRPQGKESLGFMVYSALLRYLAGRLVTETMMGIGDQSCTPDTHSWSAERVLVPAQPHSCMFGRRRLAVM